MIIKNVCVFCSSSNYVDETFYYQAELLGRFIASRQWGLVYGGTNVGLMGHIANAVLEGNSSVIGVIPKNIQAKGIENKDCTELIITDDLSARKNTMINRSDVFVALPGGFGTLEEIMEVITLKQLQLHNKPVIFLNTNNFYHSLFDFFEMIFSKSFTPDRFRDLYYDAPDIDAIENYLENYVTPVFKNKWTA
jgi:uncharacterized protein (TIGR00730 family)